MQASARTFRTAFGYYLGMLVAEKLAASRTLSELAKLRDPELREEIARALDEMQGA